MAVKRTVTKSKKDGVKKKTVTYTKGGTTVTRTKTKRKATVGKGRTKGKTTTVKSYGTTVGEAYKDKQRGRVVEKRKKATGSKGNFVETTKERGGLTGTKTKRRTTQSTGMTKSKRGGAKKKDGRMKRGRL